MLYSAVKNWYFSYFSTKTYFVGLIRSALLRPFKWVLATYFLWRNKKNIFWIPTLIWSYAWNIFLLFINKTNNRSQTWYEKTRDNNCKDWNRNHQCIYLYNIIFSFSFHLCHQNSASSYHKQSSVSSYHKQTYKQISIQNLNPCPAEPGYALPLQTV